jgi:DNA-binding beta-propeller fold protein YncE
MKRLELKRLTCALALVALGWPATASAQDSVYWGDEAVGAIRAANLDGSEVPSDLFNGESGPCGVAIDPAAGKIYWANFHGGGIRVANLDGTGAPATLFGEEGGSVCGVAVDPAAGTIYWANFSTNAIRVGNLDGSGAASTLFQEESGTAPSGVAIDPASGTIYWTNQFSDEVRVGNLDGSGIALTLVSGEDNPIGVAIDPAAGVIYWAQQGACCSGPGAVRVANLDGTGIATLFGGESAPGGVAIDPEANKIYWANRTGSIRVGNLDGTGVAASLSDSESFPLFPVLLKAPASTEAPSISGGAKVGRVLTCQKGQWAPDLLGSFLYRAPRSFAYQWIQDGVEIPGAAQPTFTPTAAGSYACRVTATNDAGATARVSGVKKIKPGKGG